MTLSLPPFRRQCKHLDHRAVPASPPVFLTAAQNASWAGVKPRRAGPGQDRGNPQGTGGSKKDQSGSGIETEPRSFSVRCQLTRGAGVAGVLDAVARELEGPPPKRWLNYPRRAQRQSNLILPVFARGAAYECPFPETVLVFESWVE